MASTIIARLKFGGKVRCHTLLVEKLKIEWSVVPSFAKPAKLGQPQLIWRLAKMGQPPPVGMTGLWGRRGRPVREFSHRPLIATPAKAICAPHFSARSSHRGFFDSIKAIFLALAQPFNCFSRPIAL
jgi:hypothetical protein